MSDYTQLATQQAIEKTTQALAEHNIKVIVSKNSNDAVRSALNLIPEDSEVMTATSTTLDQLGISKEINEGGKYKSVKKTLTGMNREKQSLEMQKLGAAPDYVIGSVHAVTMDGKVVVASGSGSQLPAYTYGSPHVIWVVSTKKIVENIDAALDRIYTHVLPQEDIRMKSVYGPESGSNVNKLFILNHELNPDRITLIFVEENLGY